MKAITTIIPEPINSKVKIIWDNIEKKFGLKGVKSTPIPHFTWHLAHDYNLDAVKKVLTKISESNQKIKVSSSGLGYFKNEMFVAYNGVDKSRALAETHKDLCKQIIEFSTEPFSYYLPNQWTPHITLVFEPKALIIEEEKLTKYLESIELNWRFGVENLTVIEQSESQSPDVLFKVKLK